MKWIRTFSCVMCGSDVIYDDEQMTLHCHCGIKALREPLTLKDLENFRMIA